MKRTRAEQFVTYSLEFGETAQAHGILGELQRARRPSRSCRSVAHRAGPRPQSLLHVDRSRQAHLTKQDLRSHLIWIER
jgi:hypothetical protein